MNRVNPRKLLQSKWTAVAPAKREKHFIVTEVEFDEDGVVSYTDVPANRSIKQAGASRGNNCRDYA